MREADDGPGDLVADIQTEYEEAIRTGHRRRGIWICVSGARVRGITKYSIPRRVNDLSLSELASRSKEYDAGGFPQRARQFRRAYHIRFAFPAATFVLALLALGICGTLQGRAGRVVAIVIALGLYLPFLALAELNPNLPEVVLVWAPNIVLTAISLGLL